MFLDINVWRCQIGIFNGKLIFTTTLKKSLVNFYSHLFYKSIFLLLILSILQLNATYTSGIYLLVIGFFSIDLLFLLSLQHFLVVKLLLRCGDVESNPGSRSNHCLSDCHYNVNSIVAHNFAKLSSLEAFNAVHNFDIICISESFLDSSFSSDDSALTLKGYKLVRADHPLDIRRGGYLHLLQRNIANLVLNHH